jgi:hypothetical protein
MSKHKATIWFKGNPNPDLLAESFGKAAEQVRMNLNLKTGGSLHPNGRAAWADAISAFPSHEYTGQVSWAFQNDESSISGKVTWPIYSPPSIPPIPSTAEFDMYWRHSKVEKKKIYSFSDPEQTCRFLHSACFATSARSLCIEPSRLPPDIADLRYQRFQRLHSTVTLTNIDWIFGLRNDDEQCQRLDAVKDLFYRISASAGFTIYWITENPLNYDSPEDRNRLATIETAIGI